VSRLQESGSGEIRPAGKWRTAVSVSESALRAEDLSLAVSGQRPGARGQTANRRHGTQWEWHPRYGPSVRSEPDDGAIHPQKKASKLHPVNPTLGMAGEDSHPAVVIHKVTEVELDEMWSFVGSKKQPRWLWEALDHHTGRILAYIFGRREDRRF
jgi:IS1 transposase